MSTFVVTFLEPIELIDLKTERLVRQRPQAVIMYRIDNPVRPRIIGSKPWLIIAGRNVGIAENALRILHRGKYKKYRLP